MKTITSLLLSSLLLLGLIGCGGNGASPEAKNLIEPGKGVVLGDKQVLLGESKEQLAAAFGSEVIFRDMGESGTRFAIPEAKVSGVIAPASKGAGVSVLWLDAAFTGATSEGLAIGSSKTALQTAFGTPTTDPFLRSAWYTEKGIVFELQNETVSRIQIIPAKTAAAR